MMKQLQLSSGDWHIKNCPFYWGDIDHCSSKTFNSFSHCGACPVRNRPDIKKEPVKLNNCKRNLYTEDCDRCTEHLERGHFNCKSCKKLTVKSKRDRDKRRIRNRKGTIATQRMRQEWMEWKEKEDFDKLYEKSEG